MEHTKKYAIVISLGGQLTGNGGVGRGRMLGMKFVCCGGAGGFLLATQETILNNCMSMQIAPLAPLMRRR